MPNLHLKSCLCPWNPLAVSFSGILKPVALPLLSEKSERSSRCPGMPNLHLKSCLCPWNLFAQSFSGTPKPVALFLLSEKSERSARCPGIPNLHLKSCLCLSLRAQQCECLTWGRLEPKFNCLRHWLTWANLSQSSVGNISDCFDLLRVWNVAEMTKHKCCFWRSHDFIEAQSLQTKISLQLPNVWNSMK